MRPVFFYPNTKNQLYRFGHGAGGLHLKTPAPFFISRSRKGAFVQQEETVKACKRKLATSKKRYVELDELVKKLYESNALGKLSDRHFERLLAEYDEEQSETTEKVLIMQSLSNFL